MKEVVVPSVGTHFFKVYFDGNGELFRDSFDTAKGEGEFKKLQDALERRDYETAMKILDK